MYHRRQSIGVHGVRTPQFLALWCPPICGHPQRLRLVVLVYCENLTQLTDYTFFIHVCAIHFSIQCGKYMKLYDVNAYFL